MGGNRRPEVASRPPKGSWEEQLCLSVVTELWKSLTDANNKCIYLYNNVARWNDSAAKEAIDNAQIRFLAKIKELPCNVPLPDPDAYLDEIDWTDSGNPEFFLEEEESEWRSEGDEWVIEGFEVVDPSFSVGVGWGPEEWYQEKKEEEVNKNTDEERACWEAYWEAKLAARVKDPWWKLETSGTTHQLDVVNLEMVINGGRGRRNKNLACMLWNASSLFLIRLGTVLKMFMYYH